VLEEMDLPAILQRAPELALIDELAHTNARGVQHDKRYQDVEDVLNAGIDVFSTVNVQHLESLNDQVAELTGVRVRETVPDSLLGAADDIVLVDITPQSLIERLLAGKVYPGERVQGALNNFFKVENLSALREVALRQVAEEVEAKRLPAEHAVARGREERFGFRPDPAMPTYPFHPDSRHTMIARCLFGADGSVSAGFIPCYIDDEARPRPLGREDGGQRVLDYVQRITGEAGFGTGFAWAADGTVAVTPLDEYQET